MLALLVTGGRKLELWHPLTPNALACETVPKAMKGKIFLYINGDYLNKSFKNKINFLL
jgi:hypothetical protein